MGMTADAEFHDGGAEFLNRGIAEFADIGDSEIVIHSGDGVGVRVGAPRQPDAGC